MTSPCKILLGIDAEIIQALKIYSHQELSKMYWPRPFRQLVINILEYILDQPQIWQELRTSDLIVDEGFIKTLIREMSFSTSTYIKVKQRKWIFHLLREMSCRKEKKKIKFGPNVSTEIDWPRDIEDKDDLFNSLIDVSLRPDVAKFLWGIIDAAVPDDKYCALHYFGAIKSLKYNQPIRIDVHESYVAILKDRIFTVSSQLESLDYQNLLPYHLVEILGVQNRGLIVAIEEGFHTSGEPWKLGTMGGIMKSDDQYFGVTSGHVNATQNPTFDQECVGDDLTHRFINNRIDVSFVQFLTPEINANILLNLLPMDFVGPEELDLQIGEDVYKIGRSTGLTVGTLESFESTFRTATCRYENHIEVRWKNDECRFAFSMDCGALYCVKRNLKYCPIGIHRISGDNVSYGCSIFEAMQFFDSCFPDHDLHFENASVLINVPVVQP
jgi:hypothetical protein